MSIIQEVLQEEYERLVRMKTVYITAAPGAHRDRALARIETDIQFIEKAFEANGIELSTIPHSKLL